MEMVINKNKIKILAQPRSGGTFMKYFLSTLFPDKQIQHNHHTNNPQYVDILVVRDIRDSITSGLRRYNSFEIKTTDDLDKIMKTINWNFLKKSNKDCYKAFKENKKVIVLFYEEFVNNFDFIVKKIEDAWDIKIDEKKIKKAQNTLNIDNAKKMIQSKGWGDKHVGDGAIRKWEKIIPLKLQEKFSTLCGVPNKKLSNEEYFII